MSLDKKVRNEIKRGLINGALFSPSIVVAVKPLADMNGDMLSYSDVIIKGENVFANVYNIYFEAIQRLYENPVGTSLALVSIPLIFATFGGGIKYLQLKSEEIKRESAKEERILAKKLEE